MYFAAQIPQIIGCHRFARPGFEERKGRKGMEEEGLAQGSSGIAKLAVTIAALLPLGLAG